MVLLKKTKQKNNRNLLLIFKLYVYFYPCIQLMCSSCNLQSELLDFCTLHCIILTYLWTFHSKYQQEVMIFTASRLLFIKLTWKKRNWNYLVIKKMLKFKINSYFMSFYTAITICDSLYWTSNYKLTAVSSNLSFNASTVASFEPVFKQPTINSHFDALITRCCLHLQLVLKCNNWFGSHQSVVKPPNRLLHIQTM